MLLFLLYLCVWLFILAMDLHTDKELKPLQYCYTHMSLYINAQS